MGAASERRTPARAMTSLVYWTLLGLVIERASYGQELYNRFERMYGDVLPLSGGSHIYGALDSLEARELIESVPGTGPDRQPRIHYKATPLGASSYENWLAEQIPAQRRSQALWVRQLAIFANDPGVVLRVLGRSESQHLKGAGQTGRSPGAATESRAELIDDLVAERQRLADGGMLSWLQYAQDRFEARARRADAHDPPRA
jgi:DNA-binding PadR family transcriptional regulator